MTPSERVKKCRARKAKPIAKKTAQNRLPAAIDDSVSVSSTEEILSKQGLKKGVFDNKPQPRSDPNEYHEQYLRCM